MEQISATQIFNTEEWTKEFMELSMLCSRKTDYSQSDVTKWLAVILLVFILMRNMEKVRCISN